MATRIYSDWSEIDAEIDRVATTAITDAHKNLNGVLDMGGELVRDAVHVETGALSSTVSAESKPGFPNWHGSITVGGPLRYAWYEYRRGGEHEFFYPLPLLHERYIDAILDGLRR